MRTLERSHFCGLDVGARDAKGQISIFRGVPVAQEATDPREEESFVSERRQWLRFLADEIGTDGFGGHYRAAALIEWRQ
jgi:hypothetical protein